MSVYYLKSSSGAIYQLDATSQMLYTMSGSLTSYVMSDLSTSSDHYINDNDTIELSGVISDIKSQSNIDSGRSKSTYDFITGLQKSKTAKESFTVYWGLYSENSETSQKTKRYSVRGCFIESLSIEQNQRNGHSKGTNSYKVSIALKKGRFAKQVSISIGEGNLLETTVSQPDDKKTATVVETSTEKKTGILDRYTPSSVPGLLAPGAVNSKAASSAWERKLHEDAMKRDAEFKKLKL